MFVNACLHVDTVDTVDTCKWVSDLYLLRKLFCMKVHESTLKAAKDWRS